MSHSPKKKQHRNEDKWKQIFPGGKFMILHVSDNVLI